MSFLKIIKEDINCIKHKDPVKPSTLEALLCYPGLHAILLYRLAHFIWQRDLCGYQPRCLARFISYLGRFISGVDIHPGAKIGHRVFIDHATGLVIGETTEIADDVTLYHGVTLGGISLANPKEGKRHPTLERGAVVGAGAQVLGPITVGECALVGANSVVTKDVPKRATAVGNPAQIITKKSKKDDTDREENLRAYGIPKNGIVDPVAKDVEALRKEVKKLEKQLAEFGGGAKTTKSTSAKKSTTKKTTKSKTTKSKAKAKTKATDSKE